MKTLIPLLFVAGCAYGDPAPKNLHEPVLTPPVVEPAEPDYSCATATGVFSCNADNQFIYCSCPASCVEITDPTTGKGLDGKCVQ
jgi:hypothetical protein